MKQPFRNFKSFKLGMPAKLTEQSPQRTITALLFTAMQVLTRVTTFLTSIALFLAWHLAWFPFYPNGFDHMNCHRRAWRTWKHRSQRDLKSICFETETPKSKQKSSKKILSCSLETLVQHRKLLDKEELLCLFSVLSSSPIRR